MGEPNFLLLPELRHGPNRWSNLIRALVRAFYGLSLSDSRARGIWLREDFETYYDDRLNLQMSPEEWMFTVGQIWTEIIEETYLLNPCDVLALVEIANR